MSRVQKASMIGLILSALSACSGSCLKSRTAQIRKLLDRELKVGDPREKVEKVLNSAGIAHEYDRFQNRDQATVTDARCGPYDAISIYVNFDSAGKMAKWEVFESHTAP